MKKIFGFDRKKEPNEFEKIDGIIRFINQLKDSIGGLIITLLNEGITDESKKNLETINRSWEVAKGHIKVISNERKIIFSFTEEMNTIQNPVNYNKPEVLLSHYSQINKILSQTIAELEEYKKEKISEYRN